jgi:hypothetical protein
MEKEKKENRGESDATLCSTLPTLKKLYMYIQEGKQHKQLKRKMKSRNEHVHSRNCRNIVNSYSYENIPLNPTSLHNNNENPISNVQKP